MRGLLCHHSKVEKSLGSPSTDHVLAGCPPNHGPQCLSLFSGTLSQVSSSGSSNQAALVCRCIKISTFLCSVLNFLTPPSPPPKGLLPVSGTWGQPGHPFPLG